MNVLSRVQWLSVFQRDVIGIALMPALKLSHSPDAFYAISRTAAVEKIESQGCLPTRTVMHTHAIDTAAICDQQPPRSESSIAAQISVLPSLWRCLPLQQLANFEVIHQQFAAQQVWFESAIALRPSNPMFQVADEPLTLMAHARDTGLKITLGGHITEIDFGFISNEPLMISCLDDQGHCLAIFKDATRVGPAQEETAYPETPTIRGISLDTRGAKTLRIDSRAPFVLTRFWVKQVAT